MHSVNKYPPCSNSLDSFDFAMRHQLRKSNHVQIIETASILHVQWAYLMTMASSLMTYDTYIDRSRWMPFDKCGVHSGLPK